MDSGLPTSLLWWLVVAVWAVASKRATDAELESMRVRLEAAEKRAKGIEAIGQKLKDFERVTMLAHLAIREARERREGVRSEPSKLENLLAVRLNAICQERQALEALEDDRWDRM
jgi:hypothetical protein